MSPVNSISFGTPVAICAEEHLNYAYRPSNNECRYLNYQFVPVALFELVKISAIYPILFLGDEHPVPVAIRGPFGQNKHAFGSGHNDYQPGLIQLYPFMLEKLHGQDTGLLLFDSQSNQIVPDKSSSGSLPFFNAPDMIGTALSNAATFAARLYEGRYQAELLAVALKETGLLVPSLLDYSDSNSSGAVSYRFYCINEAAYQNLPLATLELWFKKGWLSAISLINASQQHWNGFLNQNNGS